MTLILGLLAILSLWLLVCRDTKTSYANNSNNLTSRFHYYGTVRTVHNLPPSHLWNPSLLLNCSHVPRLMLTDFTFSPEIFLKYVLTIFHRACIQFAQLQHSCTTQNSMHTLCSPNLAHFCLQDKMKQNRLSPFNKIAAINTDTNSYLNLLNELLYSLNGNS